MHLLRGAVRTYAWGSRTAIADFTGRPSPTAHPEAELWFGAHPGDPAWLETDKGEVSLLDALRSDPEGQLGAAVRGRFGDCLPFLVKVLAADEPLSLQAHPSAEQAVEGFAREEKLGIPVNGPTRNYRDRSHKPELLVAVGQFEALAGFRTAASSVELMHALAVSDLDPFVNLLSGQSDADGLRALFTTWITAPQPDLDVLVPAVIEGAIHYVRSGKKKFAAASATRCRSWSRFSRPTNRCRCRRTRAPSRRWRDLPARTSLASRSTRPPATTATAATNPNYWSRSENSRRWPASGPRPAASS